jgi:hypothetical protein
MRIVTFFQSQASVATVSWTVDRDSVIVGTLNAHNSAVFSNDPAVTYASHSTAPTSSRVEDKLLLDAASFPAITMGGNLRIPVSAGEVIYCAFTATKGTAALILAEPDELK